MMDAVKCNDYPLYPQLMTEMRMRRGKPAIPVDGYETVTKEKRNIMCSCHHMWGLIFWQLWSWKLCAPDISYQISTIVKKVIITPWLQEQMAPSPSSPSCYFFSSRGIYNVWTKLSNSTACFGHKGSTWWRGLDVHLQVIMWIVKLLTVNHPTKLSSSTVCLGHRGSTW